MPARRLYPAALCAGLVLLAAAANAQSPPRRISTLDRAARAELIDSLSAALLRTYVEADTAAMIARRLRERQSAGAYDALAEPAKFAEQVTTDLRSLNGDLHLSLRYDPEGATAGGPVMVRRSVPQPIAGAGGGSSAPGGAGSPLGSHGPAGPGSPVPRMFGMGDPREQNFGLTRVEVLPGNVGLLEITGFLEAPGMEEALVAALRFIEHTDAVIIDLRRNRGGSGNMSHLTFSHFLGATPVPTIHVKSRIPGMSRDQTSVAEVPGPRRPDVPLYVLTSRSTGSAGEEFTFVLQNLKRALVVGDRTAGAGHMVQGIQLPNGFAAGVSITRVSQPGTGREWEAVGVQPDVRVAPERALATAHAAALRSLAKSADEAKRRTLEMAAEWVEARDRNEAVPTSRLAALAGAYEGDRVVEVRDGRLRYRRGERVEELVALGGDRFSIGGEARLAFAAGSPAPSVTVERSDGTTAVYRRVSAD